MILCFACDNDDIVFDLSHLYVRAHRHTHTHIHIHTLIHTFKFLLVFGKIAKLDARAI